MGEGRKSPISFFFSFFVAGEKEERINAFDVVMKESFFLPGRTCNVVYMCVREQGCYYKKAIEILNEGGKPFLLFKACNLVANSMKGCYVMLAKIAKMRSI